ncbi:DUF4230 domain-containing protein [Vallitalea guaymasensis]|uniref:DUF4230 domain-containing protein n=1 Tax=Vallitalea guaymasensis TaxID=1185412 RepID=UPI000DE1F6AF|nr:DUF4230 domain-containing protein [Vallitalea guaymasensis]
MKSIITKIVSVVILCILIFIGIKYLNFNLFDKIFSHKTIVSTELLSEEIRDIAELCSMKYYYKDLVVHGKPKPHTGDYYMATIEGELTAGINLDNLDIKRKDDIVTIKLEHAYFIDDSDYKRKVHEEDKSGWGTKIDYNKKKKWEIDRINKIKKRISNTFLVKADENIQDIIKNLFINYDLSEIKFEYY